jgi:hypothetical protein
MMDDNVRLQLANAEESHGKERFVAAVERSWPRSRASATRPSTSGGTARRSSPSSMSTTPASTARRRRSPAATSSS